ncbi:MAG: hypothetical protein JWL85_759 [Candidatus Saccharibacteria bacterium]|nr:hypothetical protein [Candidatus Saccharibacteria bacterium]
MSISFESGPSKFPKDETDFDAPLTAEELRAVAEAEELFGLSGIPSAVEVPDIREMPERRPRSYNDPFLVFVDYAVRTAREPDRPNHNQ